MDSREGDTIAPPRPEVAPHNAVPMNETMPPVDANPPGRRSLFDDFEALFDDARIYANAEWSYQKTRAGFVADRTKKIIAFGAGAAVCGLLAAIGLTVGLIVALTPIITAWGATAVVVLLWLVAAYLLIRRVTDAYGEMQLAMSDQGDANDG